MCATDVYRTEGIIDLQLEWERYRLSFQNTIKNNMGGR